MAVSNSAASKTVRVIGPAVSCVLEIGTTWVRLTIPTLGLKPTMPLMLAGQVIEPLVSVPIAPQAKPAATAAPLPLDEPQALRSIAKGLRVSPPTALHPLVDPSARILAHSLRLVLPSTTPPPARRLAISGASRPVRLSFKARLPAVVANSRVSILSFTSTVRPRSGPVAASWRALTAAAGS